MCCVAIITRASLTGGDGAFFNLIFALLGYII